MPRKDAIVITATSRWATWDISWASTPSSSGPSRRRSSPVVTQTTEFFWLRPVAKAFGTSESAIATRGFGMSAMAHSRSTMPCSSGASCGETTRPRIANSAMRSDMKYWTSRMPPGDEQHRDRPHAQRDQHAHEDDIEQSEQEHGQNHAAGQAPVRAQTGFVPYVQASRESAPRRRASPALRPCEASDGGKDQLRGLQAVVGKRLADVADLVQQGVQLRPGTSPRPRPRSRLPARCPER